MCIVSPDFPRISRCIVSPDFPDFPGLGAAAVGAAIPGGVGSGPGLSAAFLGGVVSTTGQVLEDVAFQRPPLEILGRAAVGIAGGRIALAIVPGLGPRNSLADAMAEYGLSKMEKPLQLLNPDRCGE
jgi:hypothetical protein